MKRLSHLPKKRIEAREAWAKDLGLNPWHEETQLLMRQCISHHRLCENECNGCTREKLPTESWAEYDKARESQIAWIEKRIELVEKTIAKKCAKLGLFAIFQGDPRGCTVKIQRQKFTKDKFGYPEDRNAIGANVWSW